MKDGLFRVALIMAAIAAPSMVSATSDIPLTVCQAIESRPRKTLTVGGYALPSDELSYMIPNTLTLGGMSSCGENLNIEASRSVVRKCYDKYTIVTGRMLESPPMFGERQFYIKADRVTCQ